MGLMGTFERPHFKQPFMRGSYVEQDTPEHIRSCQHTIAACPVGARVERPEFGWEQSVGRTMPVNFDSLVQALKTFEPRAQDVTTTQAESVFGEVVQVTTRVESENVD